MVLNDDFFRVKHNSKSPSVGRVLIAEPGLSDQYFKRAVVLLVEHDLKGSVGFVLNRPVGVNLNELVPDFPHFPTTISIGGPVSPNSIHFIHTLGNIVLNSVMITEGLYWGGDFEVIKTLISQGKVTPMQVRFFVGYSGWGEEQLTKEIKEESWVVSKLDPIQIMAGVGDLWKQSVEAMGDRFKPWTIYPENPSLN